MKSVSVVYVIADIQTDHSTVPPCASVMFRRPGSDGALVPGPAGSEDSLSGV